MKKQILIVNKSFEYGGIPMALANLLEHISDEYDITLAVFSPHGPLLERVPENVKLLKLAPLTEVLGMTNEECKKYGTYIQKLFKMVGTVWSKVFGNALPINIALALQKNVGTYDVVISYHQEQIAKTLATGFGKFALKKCIAKKRIAWVHADFMATKLATKQNLKTYEKFDKIVSVSKTSMDSFITAYPSLKDKCDYCYNCIPVADIIEKSKLENNVYNKNPEDVILFSACRLAVEKGLVPALENIVPLFRSNNYLKWFIAGTGPEESALRRIIEKNHLEKQIYLLGFKQNPYPYIKNADYLFLPSLHETFSIVAREAAVFGTPVIASDIPIMREVLGENDILCSGGDYIGALKRVLDNHNSSTSSKGLKDLDDWKEQFVRIMQC